MSELETKIRQYFKDHKLPKPGAIIWIGPWARGECFAVTTGWLKLKRFCVYVINGEVHSVRQR